MYILKKQYLKFIIFACIFLIACVAGGALTPEESFNSLKKAYQNSDARGLANLLSKKSLDKISEIIAMFSKMDEEQITALSLHFGVTGEKLKKLSPREYIALQMEIGKKLNEDAIKEATSYKIIGKDIKGANATIRVENGMELHFVKEGPYWKFDPSGW